MIDFTEKDVIHRFSKMELYKLISERSYQVEETSTESGDFLRAVEIVSIPENVWVFNNEHLSTGVSSKGSKVEKTFFHLDGNVLNIILIELKSTIRTNEFKKKVLKKFNHSFDFMVSHLFVLRSLLGEFESIKLVPVCFYKDHKIITSHGGGNNVEGDNTCTKLIEAIENEYSSVNFSFDSSVFPEEKFVRVVIQSTAGSSYLEYDFREILQSHARSKGQRGSKESITIHTTRPL